jgi:hypothetical protein
MLRHKTIMCYLVGVLTNDSDLGFFLIKTHLSFYQGRRILIRPD